MISVPAAYTTANANKNRTPVYRLQFVNITQEYATHPIKTNYDDEILADGPAGYWRLGESSGTAAADSSGNSISGTYVNTPTLGVAGALTGDADTAVTFTAASSEYVDMTTAAGLNLRTALSLECWFKTAADGGLITRGGSHAGSDMQFALVVESGKAKLYLAKADSTFAMVASTTTVTDGTWRHVAATWNGTTLAMYLNGVSEGTPSGTLSGTLRDSATAFNVGRWGDATGYFNGTMDEVAAYGSVLSATRIRAHYDAGKMRYNRRFVTPTMQLPRGFSSQVIPDRGQSSSSTTSVIIPDVSDYDSEVMADAPSAYWPLNELKGTAAADSSGNALTGTYTGSPSFGTTGPLQKELPDWAVTLNGSSQYVTVPDNALLDPGDTFTLEAWIKVDAITGNVQDILDKGVNGYRFKVQFTSGLLVLEKNGSGAICSSTVAIVAGSWTHVAATKSGATVKLFINGADVSGVVTNQTVAGTATALNIGRDPTALNYLGGSIARAAIYPTALSAARIQAHYQPALTRGISSNGAITRLLKNAIGGSVVTLSQGFDDLLEQYYLSRSFVVDGYRLTKDLAGYEFTLRQTGTLTNRTIFEVASTTLTSSCSDTDNVFNVVDTSLFRAISATEYRYFIIDEEIIGFSDTTGTTFLGTGTLPVVRGAFGTTAAAHDVDATVREMIRLYGHPMDLIQAILTNTDKTGCSIDSSIVNASAYAAIKTAIGPFIKFDLRIVSKQNAADFLEDEFYQVLACYPVHTADGKLSIRQFTTPSGGDSVDTITHDNILKDAQGRPLLSWDSGFKSLMNAVSFNYDHDVFTDDLPTASDPTTDAPSIAAYGRLPHVIPSRGLRSYTTYTDLFTRANSNSLGSDWTESENAAGDIKITSNRLVLGDAAATSHGIARWTKAAVGRDQYSELTFVSQTVTGEAGPAVRMSGTAASFTGFAVVYVAGFGLVFKSYNGVNLAAGGGTSGSSYAVSLVASDVVGIRADGETLYMYLNGVEVATMATDFSGANGDVGAVVRRVSNASTVWETWSGGDNNGDTADLLATLGQLFLDRYANAGANVVKCPTFLSKHLLEQGDTVSVTSALLPNLTTGTRGLTAALYEVTQSQINPDQGNVALDLLSVG